MPRFLSIVWYNVLPARYGGQKGIAGFNEYLGHRVPLTCLCSADNTRETASYRVDNSLPVSRLQFWDPFTRRMILRYIKEGGFTHVIIEHPYHGWLAKHQERLGFQLIVHAHNIEFRRMKARGKWWWRFIRTLEKKVFQKASLLLFKTEEDRREAAEWMNTIKEKSLVIPYGITAREVPELTMAGKEAIRSRYGLLNDEKLLLFAGSQDYGPNREAIRMLTERVVPLLKERKIRFRLLITGDIPAAADPAVDTHVLYTGFVADLDPLLQAADLFINPVTEGSGVQTKNIEALAQNCTVAGFAYSQRGIPDELLDEKVFIASVVTADALADAIGQALTARKTTPASFYLRFHWNTIISTLCHRLGL